MIAGIVAAAQATRGSRHLTSEELALRDAIALKIFQSDSGSENYMRSLAERAFKSADLFLEARRLSPGTEPESPKV